MSLTRVVDVTNNNFKNAGWKSCAHCKTSFHSYNKDQLNCSKRCAGLARFSGIDRAPPKGAVPKRLVDGLGPYCKCKFCGDQFRNPTRRFYCPDHQAEKRAAQGSAGMPKAKCSLQDRNCTQCGKSFRAYPSSKKKCCTYQCHLDSGGAQRAGMAAGTMTRKYGAKKDANHSEIVDAFRRLGCAVLDLSSMGNGVPDLVVWCREGWRLVDVKNPDTGYGKRGLNPRQKAWALGWKGGPVYLVYTVDEVIAMVSGDISSIKRFPT